ncbi:hypothetical protein TrVE_jg11868 [Triparma verrucosa]|uniref:SCD domain-containing protein n=2 Tax=Triparma TaxID=722752 RepID=A0A9W6ZV09_9STRA|nr:hypothetical protein TrST_g5890 [Triparma strigata]GMI03512.1 hypothetical protein TrVE_jg11868 [Triparma verrucosa]
MDIDDSDASVGSMDSADYDDENAAPANSKASKNSKATKKAAPQAKKRKQNNMNTTLVASVNTKNLVRNDEKNVLLTQLLTKSSSVENIAEGLVSRHNADANAAQCELINALFRSVGGSASCELDPKKHALQDVDDDEWATLITNVVADMQNAQPNQVLITASKKPATKAAASFLATYKNFWFQVADAALTSGSNATAAAGDAAMSARLDVALVKELILRVTELVGVGQPDIRYASTLAAFEMSRAILAKITSLGEKLSIAERQMKSAKGARAGSMKSQVESLKEVITDMEELVTGPVYAVIFMHRYRDSNEHLRVMCLQNLATSMVLRPSLFLADKYLKYFGWMLSDLSPTVRVAALAGLTLPFETVEQRSLNNSDNGSIDLQQMQNVCMKFLPRVADCCIDVNASVHAPAMKLLLCLLKEGFLDEFEDEQVWDQINFCAISPTASVEMRKNALEFVIEQLEAFDDLEDDEAVVDEERTVVAKIDAIASWVAHAITGERTTVANAKVSFADYVVQSLRSIDEHSSITTNWSAQLRAINEDSVATTTSNTTADKKTDAVKQLVLMRMLMASVKEEVGSVGDADFLTGGKKSKAKKNKTNTSHEKLSIELLKALPALFVKFSGDSKMLQQLASLPRYLIHSVFSLPQRKADFTKVLKEIGELYVKSTEEAVLTQCAMSLAHMAGGSHARAADASKQMMSIVETLKGKVSDLAAFKLSNGKKKKKGEVDADSEFALGLALTQFRILAKRVDIFDKFFDGDVEEFVTTIKECAEKRIEKCKDSNQTLEESKVVVKEAMNVNLAILAWKVTTLHAGEDDKMAEEANEDLMGDVAGADDENDADAGDQASAIVSIRDHLVELCTDALELKADGEAWEEDTTSEFAIFKAAVQKAACESVSDVRSICAKGLKNAANSTLRAVAFTDDSKLLTCLTKYVKSLDKSSKAFTNGPLLAIARDLVANWDVVNRREAGVVLSNINGSNPAASKLVSAFIKIAKNKDGVKLLEAHMASLRSTYEDWQNTQPEDLPEKPTEEEVERYTEEEHEHEDKYNAIRTQASKLSSSLGVTKLSNPKMSPAMVGFVREGLRYAFSCPKNDAGEDDQEQFGDRLSFLGAVKPYLSWIKKEVGGKREIEGEYESREREFRSSLFFQEDVHGEILKAFGDDFINTIVTKKRKEAPVDTHEDVFGPADTESEKPSSKASSSMLSIAEEKGDEVVDGMFDGVKEKGSESKRRKKQ